METAEVEGGSTCQLCQKRAKTTKALKNNRYKSDIEDIVHIAVVAPSTPQLKHIGKKTMP